MGNKIGSRIGWTLLLIGGFLGCLSAGLLIPVPDSVCKVAVQVQPGPLEFPSAIEGTPLVAEQITPYDGHFMEDGLDRQVSGVASVVLRNSGNTAVSWAEVILQGADGAYRFQADHIPAGSRVLVLETSGKRCGEDGYYSCHGRAILSREPWLGDESPEIVPLNIGTLLVTNRTDCPLGKMRIYYKTYMEDPGIYIGGITYYADVPGLQPGESYLLQPEHYATGYTRILRIDKCT